MKMNLIGERKRNGWRILNLILPVVWEGKGRVSHFIDFDVCHVKCMPLKLFLTRRNTINLAEAYLEGLKSPQGEAAPLE